MQQAIQQARQSRRRNGKFDTNFIKLASDGKWTELFALDLTETCVDDFDRVRSLPAQLRILRMTGVAFPCVRMDSQPFTWRRISARSTPSTNWCGEAPTSMRSATMSGPYTVAIPTHKQHTPRSLSACTGMYATSSGGGELQDRCGQATRAPRRRPQQAGLGDCATNPTRPALRATRNSNAQL